MEWKTLEANDVHAAYYRDDVVAGRYPNDVESYHWSPSLREQFEKEVAIKSLGDEFEE